jgi:hypothetical protein
MSKLATTMDDPAVVEHFQCAAPFPSFSSSSSSSSRLGKGCVVTLDLNQSNRGKKTAAAAAAASSQQQYCSATT